MINLLFKAGKAFIVLTIIIVFGCSKKAVLTPQEAELVTQLGFDTEILFLIKSSTDSILVEAKPNPDAEICFRDSAEFANFKKKNIKGISFNASANFSRTLVQNLSKKLKNKNYFIYISESNFGYAPDEVTVLKTNDIFDILRFEATNGVNYDIFIEDIVNKLTGWNKDFGLEFIAAGFDFAEAEFIKMPADMAAFSQEVYEFCPDIVDQGTGSIEELINEMQVTGNLYLWWD